MKNHLKFQSTNFDSIATKCCFSILCALIVALAGCHNDQLATHQVEGTVQFEDGELVKFGNIEFFNADHRINARGKIQSDGTFSVTTYRDGDGAVAGRHKITILQVTSDYLTEKFNDQIHHDHGNLINASYFDYRTSDLKCEITTGVNQVDLVVKKAPRQTPEGMPIR